MATTPPPPTPPPSGPPQAPLPPYAPPFPYPSGGVRVYRPGPAPGLRYAGFWVRFASYLIDTIPLFLLAAVLKVAAVTTTCASESDGVCTYQINGPGAGVVTGVLGLYWILTWPLLGGSLGQKALGLRVLNAVDGTNISIGRAAARFIGFVISAIPFAIGLIWAGFDPQKQGWHDKIAGTFVVRPA